MWKKLESKEFINLKETLFSGQVFHFKQVGDNLFIGSVYDELAVMKQVENEIYFLEHNSTIEKHLGLFFNLDIVHNCPEKREGLKFLTNEVVSTIFSFICSSNNNIKRISQMVQYLYSKGTELTLDFQTQGIQGLEEDLQGILEKHKVYAFPGLRSLVGIENELRLKRFGYRAEFICHAAIFLLENKVDFKGLSYEESRAVLMRIKGVGRKVADCICLIGLKHFHVVPLDTHLIRHSVSEFNLSVRSINDRIYSQIQQMWIEKYGIYAGIVQLYAFKRNVEASRRKVDRV